MRRDSKQPSGKLRRRFVTLTRTIHAQKYFLRQFLCNWLILQHPVQEVHHWATMLLEQQGEAGGVALSHPEHQFGVSFQRSNCLHVSPNTFRGQTLRAVKWFFIVHELPIPLSTFSPSNPGSPDLDSFP